MEKRVYTGLDEREDYYRAVDAVEGGTCSPGGAAAILRCSRQRIWALIKQGRLRAWEFYDGRSTSPEMVDVSIRDVVAHGVETGRIKSQADSGISAHLVRVEIARALGVDEREQAAVD